MNTPVSASNSTPITCPSCGGRLQPANWYVKLVVCEYCGSSVAIEGEKADLVGKMAGLVEAPSRFAVGKSGKLRGRSFRVLGRVRFEADDAFWDEWHVEFADGEIGWLEEDQGQYALTRMQRLTSAVPAYEAMQVGTTVLINGRPFFVTELCEATVVGAEGQLPIRVRPGQPVRFVDGNVEGKVAALEYADDGIEYTLGEPLERQDVVMDR